MQPETHKKSFSNGILGSAIYHPVTSTVVDPQRHEEEHSSIILLESTSGLGLTNALHHEAVADGRDQEEVFHLHRLRRGEFGQLKMATLANELGDAVSQFHVCQVNAQAHSCASSKGGKCMLLVGREFSLIEAVWVKSGKTGDRQ